MIPESEEIKLAEEIKLIGSNIIRSNTEAYSKEALRGFFPSPIDGLKLVRRRIFYSLRDKTGEFEGSELISRVKCLHEHESSIYDAAIRIGQLFRTPFPLITIKGDDGTYGGDRAASSRYNKFELSEFCKDIFIRGTDLNTIPKILGDNLKDYEPEHFIPKIPTALLYDNNTVGFGFKCLSLPRQLENICDLVMMYSSSKDRMNWFPDGYTHLLLPFFPVMNRTLNIPEILEEYKNRNFHVPVEVEGAYDIVDAQTITIRTFAFGVSADSMRDRILEMMRDKNNWLTRVLEQDVKFLSDHHNYAKILIKIKKSENILEIMDRLKQTLSIADTIHPYDNYVRDGMLVRTDPIAILKMWYAERSRSIISAKKHRQQALQYKIMIAETYLIINDYVDDVVDIIRNNQKEEAAELLYTRFKLSRKQSDILFNSKFINIAKHRKADLQKELDDLKAEYEELLISFKNVDQEIYDTAKAVKEKYKTNKDFRSCIDVYIGAVMIETIGSIQFKTDKEMLDINNKFKKYHRKIYYYEKRNKIKVVFNNKKIRIFDHMSCIPFTTSCNQFTKYNNKQEYTFSGIDNKSAFCKGIEVDSEASINYVSRHPFVVSDKDIRQIDIEDFHPRDKLLAKRMSDIYYAFDIRSDITEYVILSINSTNTSSIRVQNINLKKNKEKFLNSYQGTTYVLGVFPKDSKNIVINLPKGVAIFSSIIIKDINKFIGPNVKDIGIKSFERIY